MYNGPSSDWNQKKIKAIIDQYGHQFFVHKKVLDLGCGQGDIGGVLHRLGADVTALDARQDHLKLVAKKYAGVKTIKADLDGAWPFYGKNFDVIVDIGVLCHLKNFEEHLRNVCASTTYLILETAVVDSDDAHLSAVHPDSKKSMDGSFNGFSSQMTASNVERILRECGMSFKRSDNAKFNSGSYVYDWIIEHTKNYSVDKRRIWFCINECNTTQSTNIKPIVNSPLPTNATFISGVYPSHLIGSKAPVTHQKVITTKSPMLPDAKPPNNISSSNNNFRLSICTYCKDETPYLEEWLNFHRCVGVEHFYIYDNLSKIPVTETLKKYVDAGFVDVIDFPGPGRQLQAHQHYIDNFKTQSEWCAFIDIDEFIVPKSTDNIQNILKDYRQYGALCVPWVKFSSNGHLQKPVGLVMENYTASTTDTLVKVIGHMPYVVRAGGNIINAHIFTYQNGFYAVDEQHKRVMLDHARTSNDKIQINHYLFKSKQEFEEKFQKAQICRADEETTKAPARGRDEFNKALAYKGTDKSIFRFIEKTKKLYL